MTTRSKWRGHTILIEGERCQFEDIGEDTVGSDRPCGRCGQHPSEEGHDACLGTLPGVMNACCGHGEVSEAYVQLPDRTHFQGQTALDLIDKLRTEST